VYLDNPNQMRALALGDYNVGTQRELFFLDMLSIKHEVQLPLKGDFLINMTYLFEIYVHLSIPKSIIFCILPGIHSRHILVSVAVSRLDVLVGFTPCLRMGLYAVTASRFCCD